MHTAKHQQIAKELIIIQVIPDMQFRYYCVSNYTYTLYTHIYIFLKLWTSCNCDKELVSDIVLLSLCLMLELEVCKASRKEINGSKLGENKKLKPTSRS